MGLIYLNLVLGWYDVKVLPVHEFKWSFKEGDVAILSSPRPGSGLLSNMWYMISCSSNFFW